MGRQIVGKQTRLNVKTVKNNQQIQLDNSTSSNITMDSSENPFQGRTIARSERDIKESDTKENTAHDLNSTFEKPKTPEKNMIPSKDLTPRTPVREEVVEQSGDDKGENPSSREAAQNSDNHVEVEKTESKPDRIIPNGKTI